MHNFARLAALCVVVLAGCASHPQAVPPNVPPSAEPLPASYNWRVLLIAPFGSTLKDIPFKLHEILLFGEGENAPATNLECYGIEQEAPTFLKRTPDEYLLCFKHDRLAHIEAVVNVPKSEVQKTLTDACELWLKNIAAPSSAAVTEAKTAIAEASDCGGVDGTITFKASLDRDNAEEDTALTVKLYAEQP